MAAHGIDRTAIAETHKRISARIRRTPTLDIDAAELDLPPGLLTLKLEYLQHSGSFKARGAFANLLSQEVPEAGVAAASGGNHGAAVAFAASRLGHKAHIFVPTIASPAKIARVRGCGADLVVGGDLYSEALKRCQEFVERTGALAVHAYDAPLTVRGQGTIALELEEQAPYLDTVLVAVGGGGLIGGVAAWYGGKVKVIGVEPENAPTLHAALKAKTPIDVLVGGIAADSLGASRAGALPFAIAKEFVDRSILVTDDAIGKAQRLLWDRLRIVAEPGGAAALAALTSGAYQPAKGERIGVLVCGANTTAVDFDRT